MYAKFQVHDTKFCPKLKTSENFSVQIWKLPPFVETLLSFWFIFQYLFHCSGMKIFLPPTYFLIITLLEVQLPGDLNRNFLKRGTDKLHFFQYLLPNLDRSVKIRGKTVGIRQILCSNYFSEIVRSINFCIRNSMSEVFGN